MPWGLNLDYEGVVKPVDEVEYFEKSYFRTEVKLLVLNGKQDCFLSTLVQKIGNCLTKYQGKGMIPD